MKGYRFYLEHLNSSYKRKSVDNGNVIAIQPDNSWWSGNDYMVDAVGTVFSTPNSPVQSCNASWDYIHKYCKRISEKRAREIHPALFEYLDYNP